MMHKMRRILSMLMVVMLFAGFFTAFVAAEGTSFDDAKEIGEGTYSGNVEYEYYYKVSVPAYKAILVTITTGMNSTVGMGLYDSERQEVDTTMVSNGEVDKVFYDGKSSSSYSVYIKISNLNLLFPSSYKITVEFTPSDMKEAAQPVNDGQHISGTIKASLETHWYKINVPQDHLLNVTFSSNGGDIMVTLYDEKGKLIDAKDGTTGYVSTEIIGETGTIYIEVTSFEFQNKDISYSITPTLVKGQSEVEKSAIVIGTTCLIGIVIGIVVVILLILVIIKVIRRKKK